MRLIYRVVYFKIIYLIFRYQILFLKLFVFRDETILKLTEFIMYKENKLLQLYQ